MGRLLSALPLVIGTCAALLPVAPRPRAALRMNGFFDDLMDKLDGGDDAGKNEWKDEMMREQREILKRRQVRSDRFGWRPSPRDLRRA